MTPSVSEVARTAHLRSDLERGLSLPASWYTDATIAQPEQERVFRRTWQYIGRTEQVANRGDFVTGAVGSRAERSASFARRLRLESIY